MADDYTAEVPELVELLRPGCSREVAVRLITNLCHLAFTKGLNEGFEAGMHVGACAPRETAPPGWRQ